MNDEIHRLSILVDEFNIPFHSDSSVLNAYKNELHNHVESGLVNNLEARIFTALDINVDHSQKEMIDKMSTLLSQDINDIDVKNSTFEPFKMFYSLNYNNLCKDFQEHLEFKFSWSLYSLVTPVSSFASRLYCRFIMVNLFILAIVVCFDFS